LFSFRERRLEGNGRAADQTPRRADADSVTGQRLILLFSFLGKEDWKAMDARQTRRLVAQTLIRSLDND
jgi:hypothetical protein